MMSGDYQFPIKSMQVLQERRPVLKAYRAKHWLDEGSNHAIWTAILWRVCSDVSFRTLAHHTLADTASALGNTLTC
jgi:hypothetical protein